MSASIEAPGYSKNSKKTLVMKVEVRRRTRALEVR